MGFENLPRLNPDRQISELAKIFGKTPRQQKKIMEDAQKVGSVEVENRISRQKATREDRDKNYRQSLMRDGQPDFCPIGRRPDARIIHGGGRTQVKKIDELN